MTWTSQTPNGWNGFAVGIGSTNEEDTTLNQVVLHSLAAQTTFAMQPDTARWLAQQLLMNANALDAQTDEEPEDER